MADHAPPPPGTAEATRAVWRKAKLLIAFLRDKDRREHPEPFLYTPKDGSAGLRADPATAETFVHVQGTDRADDVQIKLRPDKIIARRVEGRGWQGVEIDDFTVRVLVGDTWILVRWDGSVTREAADTTTHVEFDGSILHMADEAEVHVSADGTDIIRRTPDRIEGLTPDGVVSRARRIEGGGR